MLYVVHVWSHVAGWFAMLYTNVSLWRVVFFNTETETRRISKVEVNSRYSYFACVLLIRWMMIIIESFW